MLLVDALNVGKGGGVIALNYFIKSLQNNKVNFLLLLNDRVKLSDEINPSNVKVYKNRSYLLRSWILKNQLQSSFTSLLCFGNFPPTFRTEGIKVFTLFHNYILLKDYYNPTEPIINRLKLKLKRFYLQTLAKNSDKFIFQSENVSENFIKSYKILKNQCLILPFYDLEHINNVKKKKDTEFIKKENKDFIYVSLGWFHKNHENLLSAWELLLSKQIKPNLFLTIPDINDEKNKELIQRVEEIRNRGGNIFNLGKLSHDETLEKTFECEFCIFPSISESFGLGLIEAFYLDLKILASDLPYVHAVMKPSLTFNPNSPENIASVVEKALNLKIPNSEILIENRIDELIRVLTIN